MINLPTSKMVFESKPLKDLNEIFRRDFDLLALRDQSGRIIKLPALLCNHVFVLPEPTEVPQTGSSYQLLEKLWSHYLYSHKRFSNDLLLLRDSHSFLEVLNLSAFGNFSHSNAF